MIILAFDTSVNACSVAIWQDGITLYNQSKEMNTGQAENLLPMIDKAIKYSQIKPSDLNLIAVTVGPGSFTGIRISLSTAKTLGLALNIPVIGITTTLAIAKTFNPANNYPVLGVSIETKRNDFYFQLFNSDYSEISDVFYASSAYIDNYIKQSKLNPFPIIGDGADRLLNEAMNDNLFSIKDSQVNYPSAIKIAETALYTFNNNNEKSNDSPLIIKPFYLRPPDVALPK